MTLEELKQFDGRDGRPAYIAVSNLVYDVSSSPSWRYGSHYEKHTAGCDLTEELKTAPHVRSVIERFPVVAELHKEKPASPQQRGPVLILAAAIIILAAAIGLFLFL